MGGDHIDPASDGKSRSVGVNHERTDAARGHGAICPDLGRGGSGEDAIELRDAAIGNPGLLTVEDVGVALPTRVAADRGDVGTSSGLGKCKRGDRFTGGPAGQVTLLEGGGASE